VSPLVGDKTNAKFTVSLVYPSDEPYNRASPTTTAHLQAGETRRPRSRGKFLEALTDRVAISNPRPPPIVYQKIGKCQFKL